MVRVEEARMNVHRLLTEMALQVHALDAPAEAVERIAHYARVAVNGTDSGIMLAKAQGRVETPAGTSDDVTKAHAWQADLDEGPCLDAIRGGQDVYASGDAPNDERWPAWGPTIAELGYRSVVSVCLQTADRKFGSLNTYSRDVDAFDGEDVEVMQLLAVHASLAYRALETETDLGTALETRNLIGQAQGILMQKFGIDAAAAFEFLKRISQHENIKLRAVAEAIVVQRDVNARPN